MSTVYKLPLVLEKPFKNPREKSPFSLFFG